jgi:prepilin-type N-terminal cleavage/methylation domain-containing protein
LDGFKGKNGFTLLELILVIVVIAILVAVAISRYIDLRRGASDGIARGVLGTLRSQNTLIYSQRLIRGSIGTYTMRIIANSMWTSTNRGMGFTWTAANTIFTMTVGGISYRFTLTPYPNAPTTIGKITAGAGTFATW